MSTSAIEVEARRRLTEVLSVWTFLDGLCPDSSMIIPPQIKSLRGLWLVALYGALENSIDQGVQFILDKISTEKVQHKNVMPKLHGVILFPSVKSARMCKESRVIGISSDFFARAVSQDIVQVKENPFSGLLQNVDGGTILEICDALAIGHYKIGMAEMLRLHNLRERRNAVAHGRETSEQVGERFNSAELKKTYDVVDSESMKFISACEEYCENGAFLSTPKMASKAN